jgi:DNA-binding MarR family transcriptional regulator
MVENAAQSLDRLNAALAKARVHDPDMGVHDLMALLLVAKRDGRDPITQAELGEALALSAATKSRVVSRLTPEGTLGKPGLGLIRQEICESNRRERELTLTLKGRRLVADIEAALTR